MPISLNVQLVRLQPIKLSNKNNSQITQYLEMKGNYGEGTVKLLCWKKGLDRIEKLSLASGR